MKRFHYPIAFLVSMMIIFPGCRTAPESAREAGKKIPVILDTDANNEIDDQHAIAYLEQPGPVPG